MSYDLEVFKKELARAIYLDFNATLSANVAEYVDRMVAHFKENARRAALKEASAIIREHGITFGQNKVVLTPRIEGDRTGIAYADAIDALAGHITPEQRAQLTARFEGLKAESLITDFKVLDTGEVEFDPVSSEAFVHIKGL